MKKLIVETKNGGKIPVLFFENLEEAIKEFSKETVLRNFNRMLRIDFVNEANRKMSLTAKLKRAVKSGKIKEEELLNLLK